MRTRPHISGRVFSFPRAVFRGSRQPRLRSSKRHPDSPGSGPQASAPSGPWLSGDDHSSRHSTPSLDPRDLPIRDVLLGLAKPEQAPRSWLTRSSLPLDAETCSWRWLLCKLRQKRGQGHRERTAHRGGSHKARRVGEPRFIASSPHARRPLHWIQEISRSGRSESRYSLGPIRGVMLTCG